MNLNINFIKIFKMKKMMFIKGLLLIERFYINTKHFCIFNKINKGLWIRKFYKSSRV